MTSNKTWEIFILLLRKQFDVYIQTLKDGLSLSLLKVSQLLCLSLCMIEIGFNREHNNNSPRIFSQQMKKILLFVDKLNEKGPIFKRERKKKNRRIKGTKEGMENFEKKAKLKLKTTNRIKNS